MKWFFIVLTSVSLSVSANAQTAEDSVKLVINSLFTAMKNNDADLLRSCFADSAILQTLGKAPDGKLLVKSETLDAFVKSVASAPPNSLDERISFNVLKIDGPLAMAWTPYSFYFKEAFSHCGVNSFQLVRVSGAWKIQYLIDTRRRTGCQ